MTTLLDSFESIITVVVAFSALVFVHELGHFLAALLVGVRVERFFLGFDIADLALKKEINGIVYGIGILPLGGYVKLAGQADNPREEKITGAPDELTSKSLPAQALVFVAGVFMNFVFGFLILVVANMYGIQFVDPIIQEILPRSPAAQAGLQPGDKVVAINDNPIRTFEMIRHAVVGYPGDYLYIDIDRPAALPGDAGATTERISRRILGEPNVGARGSPTTIGIGPPLSHRIGRVDEHVQYRSVSRLFRVNDRITSIDGQEIKRLDGHKIIDLIQDRAGQTVEVGLLRDGLAQTVQLPVPGVGKYAARVNDRDVLAYDMGFRFYLRCSAVVKGGPAWRAGLRKGYLIYGIKQPGDTPPLLFRGAEDLIEYTVKSGLRPIDLVIERNGQPIVVESLQPRFMDWDARLPEGKDNYLGLILAESGSPEAFIVSSVLAGGPCAGKLLPGDKLLKAGLAGSDALLALSPGSGILAAQISDASTEPIVMLIKKSKGAAIESVPVKPVAENHNGVPRIQIGLGNDYLISKVVATTDRKQPTLAALTKIPEGAYITGAHLSADLKSTFISYKDPATGTSGEAIHQTPAYVLDAPFRYGIEGFAPFRCYVGRTPRPAPSLAIAITWSARDSVELSLTIYNFLHKLMTGMMSPKNMGGPVQVYMVIAESKRTGFGYLLYIVAFISINLAVFNLLPFPVLDGGHLMFLLIEAVKGSPPSPRVKEVAQYIGIMCLLTLMLVVTVFDLIY